MSSSFTLTLNKHSITRGIEKKYINIHQKRDIERQDYIHIPLKDTSTFQSVVGTRFYIVIIVFQTNQPR